MTTFCSCRFIAGGLLLNLCCAISLAQTTAGLNGSVTDASGAVISAAKVVVTNVGTGIQREASSDVAGLNDVRFLQPSTYNIIVQKESFRQVTREDVRLEVNQVARIDFVMQLGAVTETVEVRAAAAPLLESSNSSVGQVIETKAVSDLPLNGRNFAQLAILSPGAIGVGYGPAGTIGSGSRPDDTRPGAELMRHRLAPTAMRTEISIHHALDTCCAPVARSSASVWNSSI